MDEVKFTEVIRAEYYEMIVTGRKSVEGRKAGGRWSKLHKGDTVAISDGFTTSVIRVTGEPETFGSLETFLHRYGEQALPGVPEEERYARYVPGIWESVDAFCAIPVECVDSIPLVASSNK